LTKKVIGNADSDRVTAATNGWHQTTHADERTGRAAADR